MRTTKGALSNACAAWRGATPALVRLMCRAACAAALAASLDLLAAPSALATFLLPEDASACIIRTLAPTPTVDRRCIDDPFDLLLVPEPAPPPKPPSPWLAKRPAVEEKLDPRLRARMVSGAEGDRRWRLEYRVSRGDTLGTIAKKFNVPLRGIVAANNLPSVNKVVLGQWLHVPSRFDLLALGPYSRLPDTIRSRPNRVLLILQFERYAAAYGLPVDLLQAIAWVESRWQSNALSHKGAMGIGQLMPDTVDFVAGVLLRRPHNPWVAEDNIRMSARFMRYLIDKTGDLEQAIGAYYQGLGALRSRGFYGETYPYVKAVLDARSLFAPPEPEWEPFEAKADTIP